MPKALGTYLIIFILLVLVALTGYNYFEKPFAPMVDNEIQPQSSNQEQSLQEKNKVAEYLEQLTPKQKILQLIAVPVDLNDVNASSSAESFVQVDGDFPGTMIIFGEEVNRRIAQDFVSEIKRVNNSMLIAVDHEGGDVTRLNGEGFLKLPSWQVLCGMNEAQRSEAIKQSASEISAVGVDVIFGPVVDVGGEESALGNRICSEDYLETILITSQAINIYQENGIQPVIKHFPGIGSLETDQHQVFGKAVANEVELEVYHSLLKQFPGIGVMTSHLGLINQNPNIPCSLSSDCVSELTSTYPSALVFSDALNMVSARYDTFNPQTPKPLTTVSFQAISAGNDILVFAPGVDQEDLEEILQYLLQAYQTDSSFASIVNQRVEKVLTYKFDHNWLK